jgi:hypothetical protein
MNRPKLLAGLALLAPLTAGAAPNATIEEGTVLWWDVTCNFYIVQTPSGFTLFEWMSGPKPEPGNVIEGPLEGFGPRNLINKTADNQVSLAYTEVHSTSKRWVVGKIPGFCKRKKGLVAQVEHERAGAQPGADAPAAAPNAQPATQ